MTTKELADPQSLPEKLDRMAGALADPELSADGVVDLAFGLADLAQQAALELELAGQREEAINLYDRLARTVRQAAGQRPEDERALVESIAEFWALSAESWRATAPPAERPQPAAKPPPEPLPKHPAYRAFVRGARPGQPPGPGQVRPPAQPWAGRLEPFGPRARPDVPAELPRALRESATQRAEGQRQWLETVRALTQSRITTTAISEELKKPAVSKDIDRLQRMRPPKGSR